jgi:hypothetical protein
MSRARSAIVACLTVVLALAAGYLGAGFNPAHQGRPGPAGAPGKDSNPGPLGVCVQYSIEAGVYDVVPATREDGTVVCKLGDNGASSAGTFVSVRPKGGG